MFKVLVEKTDDIKVKIWLELPLDWSEIEGYLAEYVEDYDPDTQDIYDLQEHFDVVGVKHGYIGLDHYWKDKKCSIINFNEIAEQLEDMDEENYNWFLAYYYEYPTRHIIDILSEYAYNSKYWGNRPITDVAEEIVDNCYADELSEFAREYFDYYKYAQYLLDGDFCETPHGILELM